MTLRRVMPATDETAARLGKPRIALAASSYLPHLGGVEEHTRRVAIECAARGYAVEVWTVRRDGLPARDEADGITVQRLASPLPSASPRGLAHFAAAFGPAASEWRAALREFAPDLLHVQCFGPNGVYAAALSRLAGLPLVISLHGETFMDDDDVFAHSALLRKGLRHALRHAAAVTGCSRLVTDDAEARFGLRPGAGRVVFGGIDLAEQAVDGDWELPCERSIFALGRLVPNKGFDLLVDAFARLAPGRPGLGLVIAGDGPQRKALQDKVIAAGLADRVLLPGRASRAQVAAAMADAELFVLPSRVEPFGLVVLEAWRAGTPVIVSNRGGAAEFVRDGADGVLVDPLDTAALAAVIDRLAGDAALRARLGAAGRQRVSEFGIGAVVDEYEKIYRSIFAGHEVSVIS